MTDCVIETRDLKKVYQMGEVEVHARRHARLGDLDAGLALLPGPRLCPYVHCCCTVPIQRGMIDGVPPGRDGGGD